MCDSVMYRNRMMVRVAGADRSRHLFGFVWACVLLHSFFAASAFAQANTPPPPPVGPATYRSDQQQIGVGLITGLVKTKTAEIVQRVNDNLRARGESVRVSLQEVKVYAPSRVATEFTNRPNQWFVKVPMNVHLKVDIPASSDRQIYIPLDINISCEGWHTGKGTLRLIAQPGPISVEGGNIIEEAVGLKDYVDSQVRSNFPTLSMINATPGNPPTCSTIGTTPGEPPDYRFGFIAYDRPITVPRGIDDAIVRPTVVVTFLKLKRLRARGRGGVLYSPTENITLDAYANFTSRQSPVMTMHEDEELNLSMPPFVLKAAGLETLVVLANINQQPLGQPQDSAFDAWPKSSGFPPGTHTLQITKVYVEPPGQGHTKPLFIRVPAYELTYTLRYSDPGLVR